MTAALVENETWTRQVIERIQSDFAGEITAIQYRLGSDRSGDPAIFLEIVVADAVANSRDRLADVVPRVDQTLSERLDLPHTDYTPYTRYFSESEAKTISSDK